VIESQLLVLQRRYSRVRVNGELLINIVLLKDAVLKRSLMAATGQGTLKVIQIKAYLKNQYLLLLVKVLNAICVLKVSILKLVK